MEKYVYFRLFFCSPLLHIPKYAPDYNWVFIDIIRIWNIDQKITFFKNIFFYLDKNEIIFYLYLDELGHIIYHLYLDKFCIIYSQHWLWYDTISYIMNIKPNEKNIYIYIFFFPSFCPHVQTATSKRPRPNGYVHLSLFTTTSPIQNSQPRVIWFRYKMIHIKNFEMCILHIINSVNTDSGEVGVDCLSIPLNYAHVQVSS
jgi:hypothetical protein